MRAAEGLVARCGGGKKVSAAEKGSGESGNEAVDALFNVRSFKKRIAEKGLTMSVA
jgi:hypothetical protein